MPSVHRDGSRVPLIEMLTALHDERVVDELVVGPQLIGELLSQSPEHGEIIAGEGDESHAEDRHAGDGAFVRWGIQHQDDLGLFLVACPVPDVLVPLPQDLLVNAELVGIERLQVIGGNFVRWAPG